MTPYKYNKLDELINFINQLNLKKKDQFLKDLVWLRSLRDYLWYTEAQVRIQKLNLSLLVRYGHKNIAKHNDRLNKMYSSTIAVYAYITACLKIINNLVIIPKQFIAWSNDITNIRNRLSAHPDKMEIFETKEVINMTSYGSSMWSSTGTVQFRLVNTDENKPEAHKSIYVNPQVDFTKLKQLLEYIVNEKILKFIK